MSNTNIKEIEIRKKLKEKMKKDIREEIKKEIIEEMKKEKSFKKELDNIKKDFISLYNRIQELEKKVILNDIKQMKEDIDGLKNIINSGNDEIKKKLDNILDPEPINPTRLLNTGLRHAIPLSYIRTDNPY